MVCEKYTLPFVRADKAAFAQCLHRKPICPSRIGVVLPCRKVPLMTSCESASNNSSCCRSKVWYSPRIASSESQYKRRGKREFRVGALDAFVFASFLRDDTERVLPLLLPMLDAPSNDFESADILRLEMASDEDGNGRVIDPFAVEGSPFFPKLLEFSVV